MDQFAFGSLSMVRTADCTGCWHPTRPAGEEGVSGPPCVDYMKSVFKKALRSEVGKKEGTTHGNPGPPPEKERKRKKTENQNTR